MAARLGLLGVTEPLAGSQIEPHHGLTPLGFELARPGAAGDQPQAGAMAPGRAGQAFQQPAGVLERADPEQATEAAAIDHQAEGQLQLQAFLGQALQAEQVGAVGFGMAALGDALQAALHRGA